MRLRNVRNILGCVRMVYFLPVLALFLAHVHSPPVDSRLSDDNNTDAGIRVVSHIWAYSRFILECAASFVIFGDSVVTFLSFTGGPAGRYSFLSLFEIPHWILRFILACVVCSALSCDAFDYIGSNWAPRLADVYVTVPVATLICSAITLFIWKVPIVKELEWLSFPLWKKKVNALMWTPNLKFKEFTLKKGSANARVLIQRSFMLTVPLFCVCLNLFSLVKVVTDTTNTCSVWRASFNYSLHIVLCLLVAAYIVSMLMLKKTQPVLYYMRWLLVYLLAAVLADVRYQVTSLAVFWIIEVIGILLLISIPFTTVLIPCNCREYCGKRRLWLMDFLKNFTQCNKWLRLGTVCCHVLALTGAILAILGLPLAWFSIEFEADGILADIIQTKNDFEAKVGEVIKELQEVVDYGDAFSVFNNCPAFISAVVAAFALSLIPAAGPAASKAAITTLRTAKFFKRVGVKAVKYKKQFKQMRDLASNLTQLAKDVKKPLVVAATVENYGLVVFLMPILITGVIALFFAFWPRKVVARTPQAEKKSKAVIFSVALMLVVFNAFGLFLFETWGPMVAEIASAIPLVQAKLVKGPGWKFIENGFICALLSSVLFLVNSVAMMVEARKPISCGKSVIKPVEQVSTYSQLIQMNRIHSPSNVALAAKNIDIDKRKIPPIEDKKKDKKKQGKQKSNTDTVNQMESFPGMNALRKGGAKNWSPILGGSIPPRGWILSIVIMSLAVGMSMASIVMDWISFDPTLKPKWAKLVHRFLEQGQGTRTLQEDLDDDAKTCDLFPINLSSLMPTLFAPDFLNLWNSIQLKLQIPEFDLFDFDLNYRISTPNIFAITFATPTIACWILVLAGFVASFNKSVSFYYSGQQVMEWISKIALFEVFVVLNSVITMIKLLQGFNIPLFSLNITLGNGFVIWFVAQVLILIVWALLQIETIAPPHFERPGEVKEDEHDVADWVTYNVERTKKTLYIEHTSSHFSHT